MNVLFQKRLFDTLKHHFILKVLALNARQQWGRGLFVPGCYLDIPCIYIDMEYNFLTISLLNSSVVIRLR